LIPYASVYSNGIGGFDLRAPVRVDKKPDPQKLKAREALKSKVGGFDLRTCTGVALSAFPQEGEWSTPLRTTLEPLYIFTN
jgi:hypothetical protein